MKISIIIPVFRTEKYLPKALNSLLSQSIHPIELVIVNDGSDGNCDSIIDDYKDKIAINYIRLSTNSGRLIARIEGMKAASGDYVGFVDADDFVHENMFETMYTTAINNNVDIVHCRSWVNTRFRNKLWMEGAPKDSYLIDDQIYEKFLNRELIWSLVDKLFKNNLIQRSIREIPSVYQQLNEDMLIASVLFYYARSYYSIRDVLYYYQIHMSSIVRTRKYKQVYDLLHTLAFIREFTEKEANKKFRNTPLYEGLVMDIFNLLQNIPSNEKDGFFSDLSGKLNQDDIYDLLYGIEKLQTNNLNSPIVKTRRIIKGLFT